MSLFTPAEKEYLLKILEASPVKPPMESISAWAEGRRILPASTPVPGPWRNSVTPYGIEIQDSLSPNSGIQRVIIMKSRKCGLTTIMENAIAYYILESPSFSTIMKVLDLLGYKMQVLPKSA